MILIAEKRNIQIENVLGYPLVLVPYIGLWQHMLDHEEKLIMASKRSSENIPTKCCSVIIKKTK